LKNIKIPLPPLETQKQIVSQIEKIENGIEILENELKQIPYKKKEIYQQLCKAIIIKRLKNVKMLIIENIEGKSN